MENQMCQIDLQLEENILLQRSMKKQQFEDDDFFYDDQQEEISQNCTPLNDRSLNQNQNIFNKNIQRSEEKQIEIKKLSLEQKLLYYGSPQARFDAINKSISSKRHPSSKYSIEQNNLSQKNQNCEFDDQYAQQQTQSNSKIYIEQSNENITKRSKEIFKEKIILQNISQTFQCSKSVQNEQKIIQDDDIQLDEPFKKKHQLFLERSRSQKNRSVNQKQLYSQQQFYGLIAYDNNQQEVVDNQNFDELNKNKDLEDPFFQYDSHDANTDHQNHLKDNIDLFKQYLRKDSFQDDDFFYENPYENEDQQKEEEIFFDNIIDQENIEDDIQKNPQLQKFPQLINTFQEQTKDFHDLQGFCSEFYENKMLKSKNENKMLRQDFENQFSESKLTPQEIKMMKFHRKQLTSIHNIMFKMKDHLSSNNDRSIDQNKSILMCKSVKKKIRAGTDSDGESDCDQQQMPRYFLIQKDNFQDMKSAQNLAHNQLEIQVNKKNNYLDLRSQNEMVDKNFRNSLNFQNMNSPELNLPEMTSQVDSGGVDCFEFNEFEKIERKSENKELQKQDYNEMLTDIDCKQKKDNLKKKKSNNSKLKSQNSWSADLKSFQNSSSSFTKITQFFSHKQKKKNLSFKFILKAKGSKNNESISFEIQENEQIQDDQKDKQAQKIQKCMHERNSIDNYQNNQNEMLDNSKTVQKKKEYSELLSHSEPESNIEMKISENVPIYYNVLQFKQSSASKNENCLLTNELTKCKNNLRFHLNIENVNQIQKTINSQRTYFPKEIDSESVPYSPVFQKMGASREEFTSSEEIYNHIIQEEKLLTIQNQIFRKKSDQEVRNRYLSKLMCHRVWLAPIQQPKTHQNIVILDYDDTLLPTTYLDPEDEADMEQLAKLHKKQLNQVQDQVVQLLESYLKISKVLIITNAKKGWVEYSSSILLPKVHQIIMKYVPVVSARGEFENQYVGQIGEWKKAAFLSLWDIENFLDKEAITNLIVIGDSQYEMDAGKCFQKSSQKCIAKSIKLKENPSAEELEKQLQVVNGQFKYIISSFKSFNFKLEKGHVSNKRYQKL